MHELSITQRLVEIAEQHAVRAGARRVLYVTVEVGALSGFVPDAIAFCFDVCVQDTLLHGAQLIIERIDGAGRCRDCDWQGGVDSMFCPCPGCGSFAIDRTRGEELRLKCIDVD